MEETTTNPGRTRVKILANPVSGFGRAVSLAEETVGILRARGAEAELIFTRETGDARREARRSAGKFDIVVAVGGDGTVSEVANGATGTGLRLGIVPTGTANLLAKEFGISPEPVRVVDTLLGGRAIDLDAGRFGKRLFLGVAGVGFDAAVAGTYARRRRGTGSFRAYVGPIAEALFRYPFPPLEVRTDEGRTFLSVGWVLVTNTKAYGGPFQFCNNADPGDGLLDAVLIGRGGPSGVLRYMVLAMLHRFQEALDTRHFLGRSFSVRPLAGEVPVQLDGDPAGTCSAADPALFEVVPAAVRLLVPPRSGG